MHCLELGNNNNSGLLTKVSSRGGVIKVNNTNTHKITINAIRSSIGSKVDTSRGDQIIPRVAIKIILIKIGSIRHLLQTIRDMGAGLHDQHKVVRGLIFDQLANKVQVEELHNVHHHHHRPMLRLK